MPSRPSHKRAATSNVEASSSRHTAKKTRFVDPSEDPGTFAEEVESALENPSANRKGRVKNEGYESDSSDDGEGVVRSRAKNAGIDDNDDEDMFTITEKEERQEDVNTKKKEEYLRLGDIEGQEFHSGSEDEDNEPEDEDDAERKKKAGMGYELSSFNMRDEMEEGKFTEDGNYIRTFDPHGIHDRWMEGLEDKEIKLARRRKRQQEREQEQRIQAEERELAESGGKSALERELLTMLKKGETVLEALQRLGVQAKKKRQIHKTKDADTGAMNIEKITHLASNIMSLGETDIYSKTYEEIVRAVRSSGSVNASWEPPSADVKYEYKWDIPGGGQSGDIFGPFGEEEMKAWMHASYFGPSGEKVKVRQVGGEWGNWEDIVQ